MNDGNRMNHQKLLKKKKKWARLKRVMGQVRAQENASSAPLPSLFLSKKIEVGENSCCPETVYLLNDF